LRLLQVAHKDMTMINARNILSPCVGRCELDETGQGCLGCGRSLDEIAGWRNASDDERRAIVESLPMRLSQLGNQSLD
jgi:uncharacterized protein